MRTVGMLAFVALALSACGGTQERAREPQWAVGEAQAERGDAGRTPGLDADVELQPGCWEGGEGLAKGAELEGTPGLDADVQCWTDAGRSPVLAGNDLL
jgi:hypothetical protein